jgi:hypothetical protein
MADAQGRMVISNKDPMAIESFEEVIAEIEKSLLNMRILALNTDFDVAEQRDNYHNNIVYLKRFYERAERLALNGS